MQTLVKLIYGSRLYGTSVPESDLDHRGVYLPTRADCLLNRIKDTITDPSERDTQSYSLQYYLNLARQGQSIAIEMLAAPPEMIVVESAVWRTLRANRKRFYTKNMHAFLGFAKSMASKYSVRIERLNEVEAILEAFHPLMGMSDEGRRLGAMWDTLPESTNAAKSTNERASNADKRTYVVCGREIQATVTISHAYEVIKGIRDSYGERVRRAKDGQIEWKALAHAFRVALQAREIVQTGDLRYPLADAPYLRDMRLGRIDFLKAGLDAKLDDLISDVQVKMDASALPDSVDGDWCDQLIMEAYA